MNFELSSEHESFRRVVRDFAAAEIAPHAEAWDRDHTFPVDVVVKMGELGLFGLPFPEEYGGGGADLTTLCIAIEEIARVDHSMAITLEAGVGLGANPIYTFGTEEQRQRWLPDLCAGRALGAFGLTEPEAGSDAGGTRTKATLDEQAGEWVIDGEKAFITNSGTPITSIITVTARTGAAEISAIVVPAGAPGLEVQPPYRKMGWHASDTHGLTFTGCRVPADNLLGARGRGFAQFLQILDEGRVAIASLAVGAIEACLAHSTQYAKDRNAFGKPIGANQGIAFKCADLAVMAENARLLTYKAAWLHDNGRPFKQAAAMAKLYATEAAVTATREATQVFGGYGFMDETPVSRFYRDAKILEIGEGTSEIQRLVIARGSAYRLSDKGRRPHRTWRQRLFITFNLLVIVACITVSATLAYAYSKVSSIGRVQLGSVLSPDPPAGSGKPQNFLIVGIDSGEGLEPDDPVLSGRPPGIRSDTIMILRIDPSIERASLLSLPRDLYVPIAGTRGSDRINAAIQAGPQRLIETIKQDFAIPINHYVELNFLAFRSMVRVIDGVPIYFVNPVRDTKSGLDVPEAGCITLDPEQALAFARSRAYEERVNGRWRTDGTGDLGRVSRQQEFIRRVLRRSIAKGARNPSVLNDLINAAVANVHLDPTLTAADLLDLGRRFKDFNPDNLDMYSVPATATQVRGGSVLKIDPIRAEPMFRIFRDVDGEISPNASIVIQVNNGSGQPNQAEQAADELRRVGFTVPVGNTGVADAFDYPTMIWYLPGKQAEGQLVASYLRTGALVEQTKLPLSTGDVLVITGTDYNGVLDVPIITGTSSTTTTVKTQPESSSTTSTTLSGTVPTTPQDVSC